MMKMGMASRGASNHQHCGQSQQKWEDAWHFNSGNISLKIIWWFPMEIHSFFTGNSLGPICNGSKVGIAYKTRVGMGLNSLMLGIGVYQQLGPEIICWWENTITIDHIWLDKSSCSSLAHLVGGFNHSENYESQLGLLFFPLYGKITAIVPTHQPVIILFREYGCPSLHRSGRSPLVGWMGWHIWHGSNQRDVQKV